MSWNAVLATGWNLLLVIQLASCGWAADTLEVGVAEREITPPLGFPMAGYYHERLATGIKDPLKAKAVVFRQGKVAAAWVVCDLTAISIDLSTQVRERAARQTGIPAEHIIVSATHSHTAPDYSKALFDYLSGSASGDVAKRRAEYAGSMIDRIVEAITAAHEACAPAVLEVGSAIQEQPVSFCRRFLMRDGSVRTWVGLKHADAIRSAGPIDSKIGLLSVKSADSGKATALISSFALHLDTVGGLEWSGDYPSFIEQALRGQLGSDVISLFGTGTCGDINHHDPTGRVKNSTAVIGESLGRTITHNLPSLHKLENPVLRTRSVVVRLPLQDVSPAELEQSRKLVAAAQQGAKIDFFDHVVAYKRLMLGNLRGATDGSDASQYLSWGLTRTWRAVGAELPVEVNVITVGQEFAIVFLPGEVFVELGLAIQQASPFGTTMVVELSQCVETAYIPTRTASVGGGYEVLNSTVQPGSGELLVEAAVRLLRETADENRNAQ